MFSRGFVNIATLVLAGSGFGLVVGGILASFLYGRPMKLDGPAERVVREAGYAGALVGAGMLLLDLLAGL